MSRALRAAPERGTCAAGHPPGRGARQAMRNLILTAAAAALAACDVSDLERERFREALAAPYMAPEPVTALRAKAGAGKATAAEAQSVSARARGLESRVRRLIERDSN